MIRDHTTSDAKLKSLSSAVTSKRQDLFTTTLGGLKAQPVISQSRAGVRSNGGFVRTAATPSAKVIRAQSTGFRMVAGPSERYGFAPSSGLFMKRAGSIGRVSVVMQATDATIEAEVVDKTTPMEKKPYNPKMFENKYVKKSDISKNPIYNLASIGLDAKNGKVPQIESFQELLTNSSEYIRDRIDKVGNDPQYWIQQGVRTGFYVNAGLLAARKQKLNLFSTNEDDTDDQKMEEKKQKFEEYITALSDYETLYELEADSIKNSYYRKPWTTELGHRDLNPAWNRMKAKEFFRSARLSASTKDGKKDNIFISGMYPEYYMDSEHFDSDMWLSSKSASSYEFAMETLSSGTRDTILRQTLVPIHFWLQDYKKPQESMKVIDVGAGTGRFMTFLRDNYPEMHATALDLNPFFLEEAGKNDRYFRKFFARQDSRGKNDKIEPSDLKLVQGQAEQMKEFEDGTFDVVTCINLFTSIPSDARKAAAKEFFRVLAPGGIVSFNDAVQTNDRAGKVLDLITDKYNEQMLDSYMAEDLNDIFFSAGFKPGPTSPIIAAQNKIMSWVKPLENETQEDVLEMQNKFMELVKQDFVVDQDTTIDQEVVANHDSPQATTENEVIPEVVDDETKEDGDTIMMKDDSVPSSEEIIDVQDDNKDN